MKSLVLVGTLLIFIPLSSFSQSRLKGAKFFQAGLGFRGAGPLAAVYGGMTFSPKIKGMVGGGLGVGKLADIKYKYIFLDGIGSFTINSLSRNKFFYLNAQAGLSFNGDLINDFETSTYNKQFSFNYGVLAGLEAEFYATKNLMFILSGNQRYYIKKDFGNWRYQLGASIRFTF